MTVQRLLLSISSPALNEPSLTRIYSIELLLAVLMAADPHRLPVRISKVANRYLLFDIDDVMYLRRNHNICSPFVGTLPQAPQQNAFMGLPIELMAEEAKVLVDINVAYVVDDAAFHPSRIQSMDEPMRKAYLQVFKDESKRAQLAAMDFAEKRKQNFVAKKKSKKKRKEHEDEDEQSPIIGGQPVVPSQVLEKSSLFDSSPSPGVSRVPEPVRFEITPSTSGALVRPPGSGTRASIDVPKAYPLFALLQHKGYFMMPGIRFGCDYNVYPGDPLRFHSHFQATGYTWDEEIDLLDIVCCGRLGTTVKKSFLIGAEVPQPTDEGQNGLGDEEPEEAVTAVPKVRAFSIEWAGM
jgi:tRNA-splicing endonuclease subunit Sen34